MTERLRVREIGDNEDQRLMAYEHGHATAGFHDRDLFMVAGEERLQRCFSGAAAVGTRHGEPGL